METYSIYKSSKAQSNCMELYESALKHWPQPYEQFNLTTRFGSTHVIANGPRNAPPVVLLHGQWTTATMWAPVVARLGFDHRTYAIDQIDDVGKSSPKRTLSSRTEYAEWLLDLFEQLELASADLAGLSYGGFLAVNLALYAPERVKRLCLLCPGVPSFGPPTRKWAIHGLPMILFPSRLTAQWLVRGMSVHGHQNNDLETMKIIAGVTNLRSRIPFKPVFTDDEFRNLEMPVCLLMGDGETMYDPGKAITRARQLIPHIEAELIPNARHMLLTDQPELVVDRVVHFLDQ
jgi:pimeloyl-ACP methyl ester carboxylesterase